MFGFLNTFSNFDVNTNLSIRNLPSVEFDFHINFREHLNDLWPIR